MLATSAFGKSEKGYLISITVEIVAGLSFFPGVDACRNSIELCNKFSLMGH